MTDKDWIYFFDDKGVIIRNDKVMNILPNLSKLDDTWLKYYVLAYDYVRSPYKFRPKKEARLMAARLAFKKDEIPEEDEKVVEELLGAIYDEKHETVVALREKINALNQLLLKEDDMKSLPSLMNTIGKLQAMLDDVLEQIKEKNEQVNIGKGKSLSFFEQIKRNGKLYEMSKR